MKGLTGLEELTETGQVLDWDWDLLNALGVAEVEFHNSSYTGDNLIQDKVDSFRSNSVLVHSFCRGY